MINSVRFLRYCIICSKPFKGAYGSRYCSKEHGKEGARLNLKDRARHGELKDKFEKKK